MGVDMRVLAQTHGIKHDTIYKKSERGQWMTPRRVQMKLEAQQALQTHSKNNPEIVGRIAPPLQQNVPAFISHDDEWNRFCGDEGDGVSLILQEAKVAFKQRQEAEKILSERQTDNLVVEQWSQRGHQIREQAWQIAQKSLEPIKESGLMVTNVKEFAQVVKVAREATGLFQDGKAQVAVSIFNDRGDDDFMSGDGYQTTVITANDDEWI